MEGDEARRETLIRTVLKELKDFNVLNRSVLISFDEPSLVLIKKLTPTLSLVTRTGKYNDFF